MQLKALQLSAEDVIITVDLPVIQECEYLMDIVTNFTKDASNAPIELEGITAKAFQATMTWLTRNGHVSDDFYDR